MLPPDVADPLESMLPPELSILRDPRSHPGAGDGGVALRHSSLPFPFPPPGSDGLPYPELLGTLGEHSWNRGEPEEHQGVLNVGVVVQCEDTKMVVSIDKESLQVSVK